ncbi:MAG: diphthine--ammonia ligase [Nitrososphaeria archaeon]
MSWSGGKDCSLALYETKKGKEYKVEELFTIITGDYDRVSMHGVRRVLLEEQAKSIGIPLQEVFISKDTLNGQYERIMKKEMASAKERNVSAIVFGDIFLEDVRRYREKNLSKVSMRALFPLRKRESKKLVRDLISLGFKTIIVCVDSKFLDSSHVGRIFDEKLIESLPPNVDPAGENGEFHTFVFDGPIFRRCLDFQVGEVIFRENRFYYVDLKPSKISF